MPERNESSSVRAVELQRVRPVAVLGLSSRPLNSLLRHGVNTVGQPIARSRGDLVQEIQGLGVGGLAEIEESLTHQGLSLTTDSMVRYPRPVNRNVCNHNTWQQPVTGAVSTTVAFKGCVRGSCSDSIGRGVGVSVARLSVPRRVSGWWCGARRAGRSDA